VRIFELDLYVVLLMFSVNLNIRSIFHLHYAIMVDRDEAHYDL